MITDLTAQTDTHRTVHTDVAIIGAGVAGLMLAGQLRRHKVRVVILESGGREQAADTHPLNRVVQLGDAYSGAWRGRFRCLGGTSTRWGGALIPFMASDLKDRPYIDLPAFPVSSEALDPYLSDLEQRFAIDRGSYEEEFVREFGAEKQVPTGDPDFHARFAKWPPFKKRNIATLFSDLLQNDNDLEVVINSTVTQFNTDSDVGRVVSLTGRHQGGRAITVCARDFVLCGGAIESTRLLLLLDRQTDRRLFQGCEALGRYFYDHISAPVALIRANDVTKLNHLAGFRFQGSTMRSLRFEISKDAQANERIGSAFGHISFRNDRETGFDALRRLMRSRQRGLPTEPALLLSVLRDIPYFARLACWRVFHRQLLWPTPATFELHVVAEQLPRPDNYIELASETDMFGLPLAAINWHISAADRRTFAAFRRRFALFWERHNLTEVGDLNWINNEDSQFAYKTSQADVYHPGGTTRMGLDRRAAVVDSNLRVFGVRNLWTASTAAFPSGGGANPTLTLMLFAMRLADHLANEVRS